MQLHLFHYSANPHLNASVPFDIWQICTPEARHLYLRSPPRYDVGWTFPDRDLSRVADLHCWSPARGRGFLPVAFPEDCSSLRDQWPDHGGRNDGRYTGYYDARVQTGAIRTSSRAIRIFLQAELNLIDVWVLVPSRR